VSGRGKKDAPETTVCEGMVPSWVMNLRSAAMNLLTQKDVEAIVKAQIARAKEGDRNAIKFVFDQLLGGSSVRGATFIQNIYQGEDPGKPTKALPGTLDKIARMRRRLAAGRSAFDAEDAQPTE